MPDIKPTRSELIKLRKKIKLAYMGHSLLKKKKDGLVQEFFRIVDEVKKSREKLSKSYVHAVGKLELGRAIEGIASIESASFLSGKEPEVSLQAKNIMGVVVPKIGLNYDTSEYHYGVVGTSSYIDDAVSAYRDVLKDALMSAEYDASLKGVLFEIEKTKRRVSALEYVVIPNMEAKAAFIRLRLEEMEKENIFRLKKIKKKGKSIIS